MENIEKQKEILVKFAEAIKNFQEALRLAGMSETSILYNTINLPDFDKMLPDDVIKFYHQVKEMVVLYFNSLSLSRREIERRLGAHSRVYVKEVIDKQKKIIS